MVVHEDEEKPWKTCQYNFWPNRTGLATVGGASSVGVGMALRLESGPVDAWPMVKKQSKAQTNAYGK